jgi:hypothetical protein
MHKRFVLKGVLKFTLKQLQHVSLKSPSSGSALYVLAKVTMLKQSIKIQCILTGCFNIVTLASSHGVLPDDGDYTETRWSRFNVNFNTLFKAILLCISR